MSMQPHAIANPQPYPRAYPQPNPQPYPLAYPSPNVSALRILLMNNFPMDARLLHPLTCSRESEACLHPTFVCPRSF